MSPSTILQKIQNKPLRFWLIWGSALFVLLYATYLIFTYRLVAVSSPDSLDSLSITAYSEDFNQNAYKPLKLGNVILLKHDTLAVEASKEGKGTIKKTDPIPPFTIPTVNISLQPTQGLTKQGFGNKECLLYDQANKQPVSFSCNNTTALLRYKPTANNIGRDANEETEVLNTGSIKAFRNGYLGIMKAQTDNLPDNVLKGSRFIYYRDLNGNVEYYNPPEDIEIENLYFSRITANPGNPNEFLLVSLNGDVYKGSILGGNVDYQKYTETKAYNPAFLTNCLFREKSALCFRGESSQAPASDDHSEEGHQSSAEKGSFFEIDFNSNNPSVKNFTLDQDIAFDSLTAIGDLAVGIGSNEMLYILEKNGDKLVSKPFMKNVTSVATTTDTIYFASNNKLYKLRDPTTASLVVNSNRIAVKSIFVSGGKVLLNATLPEFGSVLHTYIVSDTISTPENSKLIDTLPLTPQMLDSTRGVGRMDLVGNTLYIQIKLSIYAGSLNFLKLNEDIEEAKAQAYDLLSEKGIPTDKLQVVFGF